VLPTRPLALGPHYLAPGIEAPYPLVLVGLRYDGTRARVMYCGKPYIVPGDAVVTVEALAVLGWLAAGCPLPGMCG
jgi:hypothetical protein